MCQSLRVCLGALWRSRGNLCEGLHLTRTLWAFALLLLQAYQGHRGGASLQAAGGSG